MEVTFLSKKIESDKVKQNIYKLMEKLTAEKISVYYVKNNIDFLAIYIKKPENCFCKSIKYCTNCINFKKEKEKIAKSFIQYPVEIQLI